MGAIRTFGRFSVHPDKILVRIWPIKSIDERSGLWLPPSAQRREMKYRWGRIVQVGARVQQHYPDSYKPGDVVICNKFVDAVYGLEGKFKLGGKYVCVTMPSEILMVVEFSANDINNDAVPITIREFLKKEDRMVRI